MTDKFNIGDWVVANDGRNHSFKIVATTSSEKGGTWLKDRFGGFNNARFYRVYTGAVSALEAAEAGYEAMAAECSL